MLMYRILFAVLMSAGICSANARVQGDCMKGAARVVSNGVNSTTRVMQSYVNLTGTTPTSGCTVTVYITGSGGTLATLTSNTQANTANPFVADATGHWYFEATNGMFDVTLSGAGIATPFTLGAVSNIDLSVSGLFDITQYGGIPDNSTANDAAFTAAIAAMPSGGTLMLGPAGNSPGVYVLTTGITITKNVTLWCPSQATTVKITGSSHIALTFSGVTGGGIQHCTIDGNFPTTSGNVLVKAISSSGLHFEQNKFQNGGADGLSLYDQTQLWIQDNQFTNIDLSAIRFQLDDTGLGPNEFVWIKRNYFDGIDLGHGNNAHAVIHTYGNPGETDSLVQQHFWIEDNALKNFGNTGFELDKQDYSFITGNQIDGGNTATGECIAFSGSHNEITRNRVNGCGSSGVLMFGVPNWSVDHNTINDNIAWDNLSQGIAIVFGPGGGNGSPYGFNYEEIMRNRTFDTGGARQTIGIQQFCFSTGMVTPGHCDQFSVISMSNFLIMNNDGAYNSIRAYSVEELPGDAFGPTQTNINYELNVDTPGTSALRTPISVLSLSPAVPKFFTNSTGTGNQPSGMGFATNSTAAGMVMYGGTLTGASGGCQAIMGYPGCNMAGALNLIQPNATGTVNFYTAQQSSPIAINSISTTTAAIINVVSVPSGLVVGSMIFLQNLPSTCSTLSSIPQVVTNIAGSNLTLTGSGVGCVYASAGTFTSLVPTGLVDTRGWIPPQITFANLSASNLSFMVYCSNCTPSGSLATACTGAGGGAWAWKNPNSGVWHCPF